MYAIVLICLGLSIVHLMTTVSMLYGVVKVLYFFIMGLIILINTIVLLIVKFSVYQIGLFHGFLRVHQLL